MGELSAPLTERANHITKRICFGILKKQIWVPYRLVTTRLLCSVFLFVTPSHLSAVVPSSRLPTRSALNDCHRQSAPQTCLALAQARPGALIKGSAELGFPLKGSCHEVTDEVLTLGNYSKANLLFTGFALCKIIWHQNQKFC